MTQEKSCIFCQGPLSDDVCGWCGFAQRPESQIPGTLDYGTAVDVYITGDVITMDGESSSYLAYDTQNQRKVILKEFLPVSMVAPRENHTVKVQRGKEVLFKNLMMDFCDLYTALSKIESKAIQKVLSVFHANGTAYVALEYVKGDSLAQNLIKRGKPYTFKEARWLFQDVFRLMKTLEDKNIVHGGISDETLIITPENTPVLTGFAIGDLRVKNEHIVYKLYDGFSAPEQYVANRFSGFYTDIFSLAVLFNYAITGKTYTEGMFRTKSLDRHIPKYALDALNHATKLSVSDRIDNIEDFVLMLDNKAEMEKPKPKNPAKTELKFDKKYIPYALVAVILVVFAVAISSMSDRPPIENSSSRTESEIIKDTVTVPDFRGQNYSDVMNNREYTQDFYFTFDEEYSNSYPLGQIIAQSPNPKDEVAPGTLIYLTVSKGETMVMVPEGLVGLKLEEAKKILDSIGIKYAVLEKVQTEEFPRGTVQGTDKMPGTAMSPVREFLVVYVSDGTPLATPKPSPTPTPEPTPTVRPTPQETPRPTPGTEGEETADPSPTPNETPPPTEETED